MTKIAIVPNAAGTGTFTIEAPNSNSNRTLTLPDSAGTVATAESTLAQFNATGSAPVYACRAWVNFDGVTTATIRASGNVSSVTRNGTADYTVNFTTAMPDANYSVVATTGNDGITPADTIRGIITRALSSGSCRIIAARTDSVAVDTPINSVSIFR